MSMSRKLRLLLGLTLALGATNLGCASLVGTQDADADFLVLIMFCSAAVCISAIRLSPCCSRNRSRMARRLLRVLIAKPLKAPDWQ